MAPPALGSVAMGGLALGGAWKTWHALALKTAATKNDHWGPRWLAVGLSGVLNRFGRWYLNFTHNAEEKIRDGVFGPDKQYVLAWHPHGAFTITSLYFLSHWWAKEYPMPRLFVCVADLLLNVPGLSEFLLLCNARSQKASVFESLLSNGKCVAVQPGGLPEQVYTDAQQEKVFFPPKLGFIRIALKSGVPLLPIYAFGENQLYKTTPGVTALNAWLFEKFAVGSLFVWGRLGLLVTPALPNPALLPVPSSGLHVRFGDPIEVGPPDDAPSDERIRQVFAQYKAELQKLFDAHKDECLPPEVAARGLQFVVRGAEQSRL